MFDRLTLDFIETSQATIRSALRWKHGGLRQTVHAMMEDYRAGATIDRVHDDEERAAGKVVQPPLLVIWAKRDGLERLYGDPHEVWLSWAREVRGAAIDCAIT